MKKKMVLLLASVLMSLPAVTLASVSNDQVLSQHIKEAVDGSTDQNTNAGTGVKTNHIVDTAVTNAKIANGAVTDAKISGTIATSKLSVGTAAGTVAAGNHTHDGTYQKNVSNIIVVANSGGDYTSINAALNAISPSENNPYVIKIAPGTYTDAANGGSEVFPITLKAYVSLIGSGANNTKIYSPENHAIIGDSAGVLIDGLTSESSNGAGIFLSSAIDKGITLRNSNFKGNNSYAAYIANPFPGHTSSINVTNCEFSGTEGLGIAAQGLVQPATINISNSKFIQTATYSSDNALDISPGASNVVISNNFYRGFSNAIFFTSAQDRSYVTIDNIDTDRGIYLDNSTYNNVVVKNSHLGASSEGTSIITGSPDTVVKISTTMIDGTVPPGTKLFQCFDKNLNLITNP